MRSAMSGRRLRIWLALLAGALVVLIIGALMVWRDDILQALLNPEVPYTVYKPPPAPDYARAGAWDQLPGGGDAGAAAVDVFFLHPTTFDGGADWNGPIGDKGAAQLYSHVMAPNYAAPFARAGRVFAPRFRQASLYTSLTVFDDAIEAREFAYSDVRAAFDFYLAHTNAGRPFLLVGVEQGGVLAARLLRDEIASKPDVRRRLVAAYHGHLVNLAGAPILCVNPLLGATSDADAPAKANLGAANATGLEWGARPGFMVRQVGARCIGGILRVSRPRSASLLPQGSWAERLRSPAYNLFWADLEADSLARVAAWRTLNRPG